MREEWRDIPDYIGYYQVSNSGRVKSLDRIINSRLYRGKVLKNTLNENGYLYTALSKNGLVKNKRVHSLVCLAFIGPRPEGLIIDHLDGDKINNSPENLEYVSLRENVVRGKLCNKNKNKTSRFVGVTWNKKCKKWIAQIQSRGVKIHIGAFPSEDKAHLAYLSTLSLVMNDEKA